MQLPIESSLDAIGAALARTPALVITAAPGAGKTTRVPRYLLEHSDAGEIWVLEPRRLAARWAAQFVARELGEAVGGRVGYRVRFDDATGPATRLCFVTEGMLLRRLMSDPTLRGIRCVVFDEFHGRTMASDVGLAVLRQVQQTKRPDLQLVVMSATLDAAPVARFLGDAPVLDVPGRQFEVTVTHAAHRDERYLDAQVAGALARVVPESDGDILVFLPGMGEIRRAEQACAALAQRHDLLLLPLHGGLSPAEQDRAVQPASRRKIILSTNVAETSVTIDGVTDVIDSGLSRQAAHDPWSGMPTLRLMPISQAAAAQRAGRAGRTRPGRCLRLYTRPDFASRAAYDTPEMLRLDFTETALLLYSLGVAEPAAMAWLDAPPAASVSAAQILLTRLGACQDNALTPIGRAMLRFALHPRLARLVVEAEARGIAALGCRAAAYLSEKEGQSDEKPARLSASSDLFVALEARKDIGARAAAQLLRQCKGGRATAPSADAEDALSRCVLTAFPDRVARRIPAPSRNTPDELLMCGGGRVVLSPASVVREAPYLVAVDALERGGIGRSRPIVAVAEAIEPDWLLDLTPSAVAERVDVTWNAALQRVEETRGLYYDGLVLDETKSNRAEGPEAAALLAAQVQAAGLTTFVDAEAWEGVRARLAILRQVMPGIGAPALDNETLTAALVALCHGRRSFAELRQVDLLAQLQAGLPAAVQTALRTHTPDHVALPGGRRLAVHYEPNKPPWVAAPLQDFFGLAVGPSVAQGRMPVTLQLLAPNRRPVQVTTDLAGFWQRHYPAIKKELSRRYPRHAWPDDPANATPPAPRRPRS